MNLSCARSELRCVLVLVLAGCTAQADQDLAQQDKSADVNPGSFEHRWAVDLEKIRELERDPLHTTKYTDRVFGANLSESRLGDDQRAQQIFRLACENEMLVQDDGSKTPGECRLWGNMMRVNYDHTEHDDSANTIINLVDGEKRIDPPGYLNIIALKHADRLGQDEIHDNLRNGDVLVYFHPEDTEIFQFRMHHAAMYYDTGEGAMALSMGDERFAHHIDNPVTYGPAFNAGVRSVPFHVYRFNPNGAAGTPNRNDAGEYKFECTDETMHACQDGHFTISNRMADLYAYQARNWALVLNGNAPFSSFHEMSWQDNIQRGKVGRNVRAEVARFAAPLTGQPTPKLYCAGLVYTNFNLALNMPMNTMGLGLPEFDSFVGQTLNFNDRYMQRPLTGSALAAGCEELKPMGQLVFEPTTGSRIAEEWVEGYFRGFESNFVNMIGGAIGAPDEAVRMQLRMQLVGLGGPTGGPTISTKLDELAAGAAAAEQAAAAAAAGQGDTETLQQQAAMAQQQVQEGIQALAAGMSRQIRAAILAGAADAISTGFSRLAYQSNKGAESAVSVPVNPDRVRAYAKVYGDPMSDNFTIGVYTNPDGELDLAFAEGGDGELDLPQMKRLELTETKTRYVPPQMYHYEANRPGSVFSYVGTVMHVDMLRCISPNPVECDTGEPDDVKGVLRRWSRHRSLWSLQCAQRNRGCTRSSRAAGARRQRRP